MLGVPEDLLEQLPLEYAWWGNLFEQTKGCINTILGVLFRQVVLPLEVEEVHPIRSRQLLDLLQLLECCFRWLKEHSHHFEDVLEADTMTRLALLGFDAIEILEHLQEERLLGLDHRINDNRVVEDTLEVSNEVLQSPLPPLHEMVGEVLVEDANIINEAVELAIMVEDLLAEHHEVEGHMQGHERGDSRVAKRIAHEKLLTLPLREVRLPKIKA